MTLAGWMSTRKDPDGHRRLPTAWLIRWVLALTLVLLHAGCSMIPPAPDASVAAMPLWEGRMFLRVDTNPPSVTQADIRLQGSPDAGQLILFGPLGTTHGVLRWSPGMAVWQQGGEERRFTSLETLLSQTLGTSLPVPSLFAWIQGEPVALAGWELVSIPSSEQPLIARRRHPAPAVDLRLRLSR